MRALFPDRGDDRIVASHIASLLVTRRWLIGLLFTQAWLFAALVGALQWQRLTSADRLALVLSALLITVGWATSRRPIGLWLITGAPLALVLAAIANGGSPQDVTWIALSTSAGHVAYGLVLLTPPAIGLVSILGCTALLAFAWSREPENVLPGALAVADGRIALALLAVSAFMLWLAWHVLWRRAAAEDASRARLADRVAQEIEAQERSRLWRDTAVRVHERLLSTLRYLVQSPEPDRAGLRTLLADAEGLDLHRSPSDLEHGVRAATAACIASGIIQLDDSVIDLPVSDRARAAARAAIVECALNAVLHGDATTVLVSAERDARQVRVHIRDDGRGVSDAAIPGLGWSAVLDTGLADVNGSWTLTSSADGTTVTLVVPAINATTTATIGSDGFAQGRTLLSAPLLAVGGIGIAFTALAASPFAAGLAIIVANVAVVAVGAVVIVRGRRPSVPVTSAALLAAAATPWLVRFGLPPTVSMEQLTPGLVTSGYTLITLALWCRPWQFIGGLAVWAAGMLALAARTSPEGQPSLLVGLVNCLVIVPVVIVVLSIATRRFRRTQNAILLQREALNRELIRANATAVIDQQLSACVAKAEAIIRRVADGAEVDAAIRHELACLEGLIRATIQVDQLSDGEFARVAARLSNEAFNRSIPARIGTIISSTDATPLPRDLVQGLESAISSAEAITIRVMTSGSSDHLSLHLHGPTVAGDGLDTMDRFGLDDIDVTTEVEPGSGVLVLVSRALRREAGSGV